MIVAIQKPDFLPGLVYFDRMYKADVHVFLDTIKLPKRDMVNRTRILGHSEPEWLVIPIERSGRSGQKICEAVIDNSVLWKKKHLKQLYHYYRNAPFFDDIYYVLKDTLNEPFDKIAEFNKALISEIASKLTIPAEFVAASELNAAGTKSEHLMRIVHTVGGSDLVVPEYARSFLNRDEFVSHGITLHYHEFAYPQYNQYRRSFVTDLSIFDVLCYCSRRQAHSFFSPLAQ